jgi:galactokinase/mevalonate kinase-like predicted kinase
MIDTSRFEKELSLCDIFILVWMKLKTSEHKEEMEKRMIEELEEMNSLCATGHLSRSINILSGFFDNVIQITYKDQIKNYIFEHYNRILNHHPKIDTILDEIIEDSWEKKPFLSQMIKQYSIYQKLLDEFVSSSLITKSQFEEYYKYSIDNFCGL